MNSTRLIFLHGNHLIDQLFAYDNDVLPSGAKLVLMCLLSYTSNSGISDPTQRQISSAVGLSERQVRKHLSLLERLGIIRKLRRESVADQVVRYPKANAYDLSSVISKSEIKKGGAK